MGVVGVGDAAVVGYCFGEDEGPDEEEEALDAVGGRGFSNVHI